MAESRNGRGETWDTCRFCGLDIGLKRDRKLRKHGARNARCLGSGRYGLWVENEIVRAWRFTPYAEWAVGDSEPTQ